MRSQDDGNFNIISIQKQKLTFLLRILICKSIIQNNYVLKFLFRFGITLISYSYALLFTLEAIGFNLPLPNVFNVCVRVLHKGQ